MQSRMVEHRSSSGVEAVTRLTGNYLSGRIRCREDDFGKPNCTGTKVTGLAGAKMKRKRYLD